MYDNPIPLYQIVFIWIQVWWQESLETIGWTSVNVVVCQLPESNRLNHWLKNVPLYLFARVYPRWYSLTKKTLCVTVSAGCGRGTSGQSICIEVPIIPTKVSTVSTPPWIRQDMHVSLGHCPVGVKQKVYTQLNRPGVEFTLWSWVPDLFVDTSEWDYVVICCRIRLVLP